MCTARMAGVGSALHHCIGSCCMHSCCSIDIEHVLSPAEQAHTMFNTHIILLDNFMLPNHGYSKQQLISSNFFDFFDFLCMHVPNLVTTTHPGCHHPPYSIGTTPTHLLALCHPHPTPPSPWVTPNVDFLCTHACAILLRPVPPETEMPLGAGRLGL